MAKLQEAPKGDLQELFDQHLSEIDALKVSMPRADDFRLPHIKQLVKTPKSNPVHEATVASMPLQAPEERAVPSFVPESLDRRQRRRRGRFMGSPNPSEPSKSVSGPPLRGAWPDELDSEDSEDSDEEATPATHSKPPSPLTREGREGRGGRRSARKAREPEAMASKSLEDLEDFSEPPEPMEPVRTCELGETLWSNLGASWVEYNQCIVPSVFPQEDAMATGATLEAYRHTRTSASLFDVSFKVCFRITGADREFVADQFLTCSLTAMRAGDVQYACILDSKGLVLDDAFVYLDDAVNILASGWHAKQLLEYLGQPLACKHSHNSRKVGYMYKSSAEPAPPEVHTLRATVWCRCFFRVQWQLDPRTTGPKILRGPSA